MTEAEWLACHDPIAMLASLTPETCLRKTRLCMVSWCRRHVGKAVHQECKEAIEAAERFADGSERLQSLIQLRERLPSAEPDYDGTPLPFPAAAFWITHGEHTQGNVLRFVVEQVLLLMQDAGGRSEPAIQAALIRDIFGNPFRPVSFDPAWRTDTAVALAQQMYDSREFAAMPILADALQDAGCEDEQVLNHCRDASQVHVRGCWVCDLVLGKN
jgi:hypothetical protein